MPSPMLSYANIWNKFVVYVHALTYQCDDYVRHFFENAEVTVRNGVKDKRNAVMKKFPTVRTFTNGLYQSCV